MIKHLIVVFTRMYAQRGSDEDEFINIWDTSQDEGKNYLPYHCGDGTKHFYVLIVHGYRCDSNESGGFSVDRPDEPSLAMARHSIIEGVSLLSPEVTLKELAVGVAFHPDWDDAGVKLFGAALENFLKEQGAHVSFVKRYSGSTSLFPPLVARIHSGQDFVKEYHRVWTYFVEDLEAYANYMGTLLQRVYELVEPLNADLEGWRESGFKVGYWQEIADRWRNGAPHDQFNAARETILGGLPNTDSVRKLVKELESNFKKRRPSLADEVEKRLQKVESAFEETKLLPVTELLTLLGKACQSQHHLGGEANFQAATVEAADAFEKFKSSLKERNDFREWYVELKSSLTDLLRVIMDGHKKKQGSNG